MDENKVEVWVSLSLGFSTCPFHMRRPLLITGCSRDARNRSAIPATVPRSLDLRSLRPELGCSLWA
ncbi:hypothetical protein DY000_02016544 [Brassica cretica]|uniref:Uncharacterized protein n=1 Tax=Brassica cretica TaxID=69181 RepID=A0ABQ7CTZ6_BRACR|nr:hypothetical protein DY000_02016544 [Brassica cretica]